MIASKVGGLPEVIDDGVDGYLRDPDDLEGMAEQALTVLGDARLHERLATAARRKVEQKFGADRVVPQYEAFYREVLV